VLARYSAESSGNAFGFTHTELLYLSNEADAYPLFNKAQKQSDDIARSLTVMQTAFDEARRDNGNRENIEPKEATGMTML
jgi:hypothetical protein